MKQLDPRAVWLFFLQGIIRWAFFLFFVWFGGAAYYLKAGGVSVINFFNIPLGFLLVIIFLVAWSYAMARLSYHFYRYELRDNGFRKEEGIIWKRYVTIPYDRIQNVDVYRGPVARILGVSDLMIQTAGVGTPRVGAEGRLPGLSKEIAENLRDELVDRSRKSRSGQGL